MLVWFFLALLLLAALARVSATATTLRVLAGVHLSITGFHLILLMLAALTHHLLLMMLSIHLLLAMLIHLFIHGILAVTGAVMLDSLVVLPNLVFSNVLVVAVKIFSLVFIPGVVVLANFAMFFTAHSCSRPSASAFLMLSHRLRSIARFASSCCSPCRPYFLCTFALPNAFVFVE